MARSKAAKIQRRAGSPGFTGCRRRVGFGDLPEEVLLRIFSYLRGPVLRPLRLVCRAFRQASIERITGVRLADGDNESSVISALRTFPGISSLTIDAPLPASVETWVPSVSHLRSLECYKEAMAGVGHLTSLMPHLRGITSLKGIQDKRSSSHSVCYLKDIVACCPALQSLELQRHVVSWKADDCTCFLQLTLLQELKLPVWGSAWSSLLPLLTCLTLLRTLTCVAPKSSEDVEALAALTQLTSLGGCMGLPQWLDCLRALTGLKRVSAGFLHGGWPTDVLGPLIRRLPTSLEGLCLLHWWYNMLDEDLRVLSGMTRLDHLEIGYTLPRDIRPGMDIDAVGCGHWSLEGANPWCTRLVGLRRLGLVGRPTGAPSVRFLAQHLALEHLRLRLELFDDVCNLSALTRLTLLHLYKEEGQGMCVRALGPPSFLMSLQQLRHLSLYWEVRVGEERETVRCLAALAELERLHVTLVPLERAEAEASHSLHSHASGNASDKAATASTQRQPPCESEELLVSQRSRRKRYLGIQVLQPLVSLGSLSELQVEGRYRVDKSTWGRIQQLRGRLGLPALSKGYVSTKTGDFCAYTAGLD